MPFVDAYEAGLWLFFVTEKSVVAVPRPALRIVEDRLHCEDGPAVHWPNGARYYFVRGVQVPEQVVLAPETLNPLDITNERNAEVRRVMLDRFGTSRYLEMMGAECVQSDRAGELYRAELADDEPLVMVKVRNSTPEPDGSIKDYWLRVPPRTKTALSGVAWTFGLTEREYRPMMET